MTHKARHRVLLALSGLALLLSLSVHAASPDSLKTEFDLCIYRQLRDEDQLARSARQGEFLIVYSPEELRSNDRINRCPANPRERAFRQQVLTRQIEKLRMPGMMQKCSEGEADSARVADNFLSRSAAQLEISVYVRDVFESECPVGSALRQSQRQSGGGCSVGSFSSSSLNP